MSLALQQVVLHPSLTATLKLTSTTVGRDKLYRTVQYFARFLAWHQYRSGASKETVDRLTALKSSLALSRKLMRVGKWLEHLQAFVKALAIKDPVVCGLSLSRQLSYALYLFHDTLQWVHGSKAYQFAPATYSKIAKRAAQFWALGLISSLLAGAYKTHVLRQRQALASRPRASAEKEAERKVELQQIAKEKGAVRYQVVQDALDLANPGSSIGLFNFDDGFIGLAGTVTSLMGVYSQWQAVNGTGAKK
ncbi:peroxisomal biogenesis factor 11 [Jaminaea rosea]|uniref:Peroxisomal biogenesis factor 11 n=1 Tax=Jaminaea rosea TaxID=1569628 RepID=A0A316UMU4_9BASI|nr:peroxisomal biogenesis factor 11 [Jaminaea rosea]PWN25243.1 peroxisomal biogenesis factor 11 [Jaminaea rosea]